MNDRELYIITALVVYGALRIIYDLYEAAKIAKHEYKIRKRAKNIAEFKARRARANAEAAARVMYEFRQRENTRQILKNLEVWGEENGV